MSERKTRPDYSGIKRPEHRSLVDIAYNVLVEAIINQEFQPGEQISIDSLARQLGMSNTPMREALMRVQGERLVQQKTNHGFVVADALTLVDIHQMFDVRHLLEIHAMQLATLSPETIEDIKRIEDQMRHASDGAAYDDYKDYLLLDKQLHRALVSLSGNVFLLKAWEDLHVHLQLSRLYAGVGLIDRQDSLKEHAEILNALENGEQKQAITLLSQHIRHVEKRIGTFLEGS